MASSQLGLARAGEHATARSHYYLGVSTWESSHSSFWGRLAGAIAKALLPGDDPGGFIVTTIIGIVGAIIGGFLAGALFNAHPMDEFFDISTWLTAIVGSIVLLLIYRAIAGRGNRRAIV